AAHHSAERVGSTSACWRYTRAALHDESLERKQWSASAHERDLAMIYVFGDCELDTRQYVLRRAGRTTAFSPKVFQVLSYLLAHHNRVISKQELCEQVWPNQFISDAALESTMRVVRQTLGDSGRTQQFIQTRRGHGYRIVVAVTVLQDSDQLAGTECNPLPEHRPAHLVPVDCCL